MRWADIIRLRLRSAFSRTMVERELDDELRYHVERQIEDEMTRGLSAEEARRAAHLSIEGFEQNKEECRDMRGFNLIDNLAQDIRFAIRQSQKHLGFSCTAVLMLALGMGASVAIFTFVDAALIKPLPYRDPGRLIAAFESAEHCPHCNLSYPDYLDWKKSNKVFSSLDAYQRNGMALSTPEGVQPARGARVSDGFFRTLGVIPVLGRDFREGEDLLAAPRSVILSYSVWQRRYGGRADALGKTVTLDGDANTIVGVLPRDFHFSPAEPAEYWTTIHAASECDLRRSCHGLYGIGRLKDGVSFETALADVTLIAKQLEQQYPGSNRQQGASLQLLSDLIVGNVRPILLVLLSGAGLLLLIATVNVASLLLVRSESRRREISVRTALGAGRARLIRQFMTEGLVLVSMGSILGLAASWWATRLLMGLIPADIIAGMPVLNTLGLTFRVLMFAAAISLVAAGLFSITPALHASLLEMREGLAEGSRGSAGNSWRRLGSKLVVLELATAMVLLVGAGLLGKSFYRLLHVDIGLQPDHLATLFVAAPKAAYAKDEQAIALERKVVREVESLPGVSSVAITTDVPVTGWGNTTWFRVLGHPWHGEHNDTPERDISPGYFTTIGAKLSRGRYFKETEDKSMPLVAIINQALAREHFPGEDPIGKQISYLTDPPKPIEIVGVVEDIKEGQLDTVNRPTLYFPFNQGPGNFFILVVRSQQDPGSVLPTLAAAIHRIDPGIATANGTTMNDRINDSPSAYIHRSSAWLVGGFAAMALLLSVVGLYGVVAYSVSQRTREIGVRMALGADRGSVYRLVLGEAGWLTAIGIVSGLVCSLGAAVLIRGLLFGVQSWDVPTLATVAAILGISALLASFLPARRAASVNPIEALRAE